MHKEKTSPQYMDIKFANPAIVWETPKAQGEDYAHA